MKLDNILDISPDASVYRIFSKARFLDLVRSRKNGLVRPRRWDDPFENFFLRSVVIGPEGEKGSLRGLAESWYGQCWTINSDTDAMWRIYSHNKDGIKIKSTVRKLFDSLYDKADQYADLKFLIGKVHYKTEAEIERLMQTMTFWKIALGGQSAPFARLLCVKREAFAHEQEVRLLFNDVGRLHQQDVVLFDFDANAICEEVVIDPRLDEARVAELTKEILDAGCQLPISQSPLYRAPQFTIPLE